MMGDAAKRRFRRKKAMPEVVEAIRWDGYNAGAMRTFLRRAKARIITCCEEIPMLEFEHRGRRFSACVYDDAEEESCIDTKWVIRDRQGGRLSIMGDREFQEKYEPEEAPSSFWMGPAHAGRTYRRPHCGKRVIPLMKNAISKQDINP